MKRHTLTFILLLLMSVTIAFMDDKGQSLAGDTPYKDAEHAKKTTINGLGSIDSPDGFSDGTTVRVSVASDGTEGNYGSGNPSLSADGNLVAFSSVAVNLVPGDTNNASDVFVHNQQTGETIRVSITSAGAQANGNSDMYACSHCISDDGGYVAFSSYAHDLVPGDTNGASDVFVHDLQTGQTDSISISSAGTGGGGLAPSLSGDGRFVAFLSSAEDLVPGDINGYQDVFVYDRDTGQTTLVSVASDGTQGNLNARDPIAISSGGRYVAFASWASNLVTGDTNGASDVFVHDRNTGETSMVSVASDGTQADGSAAYPSISGDGRYVSFVSTANNLMPEDNHGYENVFVHDRLSSQTTLVSISPDGELGNGHSGAAQLSANGRYVTFASLATNLVPNDTNGYPDVFLRDRLTGQTVLASVASDLTQGNGDSGWTDYGLAISASGLQVAFASDASNLVLGDTNGQADVFVHERLDSSTYYSISGQIRKDNNDPISGVTISTNTGIGTTTNATGYYSVSGLTSGTYILTPSKAGYAFSPASRTVTVPPDATGQDFAAFLQVPCSESADSDGDGLLDGWEVCGYDHDGNGKYKDPTDVRLPEMGADPNIPDIFVEIDYMDEPGDHTHKPKTGAICRVIAAFKQQGINLHVDYGPDALLRCATQEKWGSLSQGERLLNHQDFLQPVGQNWDWSAFEKTFYDAGHFREERRNIFHYALFAHDLGADLLKSTSGIARTPGRNFIVALGSWTNNEGSSQEQAGIFMHELGHNLGLCHGGPRSLTESVNQCELNFKPNYLSVMNYAFADRGLIKYQGDGELDYSLFDSLDIPDLYEAHLDERVGLNGVDEVSDYGTRYYCRTLGYWSEERVTYANSAINWDCRFGAFGKDVKANINDGDVLNPDPKDDDRLISYEDWPYLVYDVWSNTKASSGALMLGNMQTEEEIVFDELTFEMANTFYKPYAVALGSGMDLVVSPGVEKTVPITLTNTGGLTATITLSVTYVSDWFDASTVPGSVTLAPSDTMPIQIGLSVPNTAFTGEAREIVIDAILEESPLMSDSVTLSAQVGPLAWFEAEPILGIAPHTVRFTDMSIGVVTSREWDFGDGFTSKKQNPHHTYVEPGIYSVILTVAGPDGSDQFVRSALVRVNPGYRIYAPIALK